MSEDHDDYKHLYEAAVEHIEALNDWAAQRGVVLPDTDTAGSEVMGYVVVSFTPGPWVEYGGDIFTNPEDAQERSRTLVALRGGGSGCRPAALFLLPEEALVDTLAETGMLPAVMVERLDGRIRTLEAALRPFAVESGHGPHPDNPRVCARCLIGMRPCKYETARRALEGEG